MTSRKESKLDSTVSFSPSHFHVYNGKRRCLTGRMSLEHQAALTDAHREARLKRQTLSDETLPENQTIYVAVQFHVLTPETTRTYSDADKASRDILEMMNNGFNHTISPSHDQQKIENGVFLQQDLSYKELFTKYKKLAASPHLEFVMTKKPNLYYIPFAHKHSGSDTKDMDYWDRLLKLQIAPAVDPRHVYNIWIVMDVKSVLLGYGNFPKINPTAHDTAIDGFVYFLSGPPYHMHVTAVHESGHVWGLNHLFNHDDTTGEYEDGIDDTPFQDFPDFGPIWFKEQRWPFSTDKTGKKAYHLLMNYMNYVDDNCMFMFTSGQCKKIRETALSVRSGWNLTLSQVQNLRGNSPWISARLPIVTETLPISSPPPAVIIAENGLPRFPLSVTSPAVVADSVLPSFPLSADSVLPSIPLSVPIADNVLQTSTNISFVPATSTPKHQERQKLKSEKKSEKSELQQTLVTQHEPFPFRKKFVLPPPTSASSHLPATTLNTFGGMFDLCGSLFGLASSGLKTLDTTGKTISALSYACC